MKEQLDKLFREQQRIQSAAFEMVKNLIPVLKDHGLTNAARPFEELVFEYDCLNQDLKNLFESDPQGTVEAILEIMRRSER